MMLPSLLAHSQVTVLGILITCLFYVIWELLFTNKLHQHQRRHWIWAYIENRL